MGATATGGLIIDQFDTVWLEGKHIVGAAAADRLFGSHPSTCFIHYSELCGRRLPVRFGGLTCQWVWGSLVRGKARIALG